MRLQSAASESNATIEMSGLEGLMEGPEQLISGEDYLKTDELTSSMGQRTESFDALNCVRDDSRTTVRIINAIDVRWDLIDLICLCF